jgi:hypothetical protein
MAKYRVTSPSGETFEITAPDNANERDVMAYAQSQFSMQKRAAPVAPDPTEGLSGTDRFLAGAGKAMTDMGRGARQIAAKLGLGDSSAVQSEIDESRRLDSPLMRTGAGLAGNLAANVAMTMPAAAIPGVNTIMGAGALGGALGAAQPVASDESRLANTGFGAAGGAIGQAVASRLMRPVQTRISPEKAALAAKAEAAGIPLDAAQQTGSKALQSIDSALDSMPFTAGKQASRKATQQQSFNRAALRTIGVDAPKATPDVLESARRGLSDEFNRIAGQTTVKLDNDFLNALSKVDGKQASMVPSLRSAKVGSLVDDFLDLMGNGQIEGRAYQDMRSALSKQSKDAFGSGNSSLGQALKDIRGALDDAAGRSIPQAEKEAWQSVRQKWGNLKVLEKVVGRASAGAAEGDISPAALWSAVKQANPKQFVYGSSELGDLARVGQSFLKQMPSSGTSERMLAQQVLTGGALYGGGYGLTQDPEKAAGIAALGVLGPKFAQSIINSRAGSQYLTKGVLGNSPEAADAIRRAALLSGSQLGALAGR